MSREFFKNIFTSNKSAVSTATAIASQSTDKKSATDTKSPIKISPSPSAISPAAFTSSDTALSQSETPELHGLDFKHSDQISREETLPGEFDQDADLDLAIALSRSLENSSTDPATKVPGLEEVTKSDKKQREKKERSSTSSVDTKDRKKGRRGKSKKPLTDAEKQDQELAKSLQENEYETALALVEQDITRIKEIEERSPIASKTLYDLEQEDEELNAAIKASLAKTSPSFSDKLKLKAKNWFSKTAKKTERSQEKSLDKDHKQPAEPTCNYYGTDDEEEVAQGQELEMSLGEAVSAGMEKFLKKHPGLDHKDIFPFVVDTSSTTSLSSSASSSSTGQNPSGIVRAATVTQKKTTNRETGL